ncbi:LTA synthase family protein [Cohnella endophytica]|uniref:LTA synthase family protein n=1 Tax=Cohnella endophytica TaxID=2419778 RepID=A0A494XH64_9BACL|nr:LTA synthase family protein [Cohnella endophytica]RKP50077.1 LTA synthase family protein [Cohnella endophytica]
MKFSRLGSWLSKPFIFFTILMVLKIFLARYVVFENSSIWLQLATGIPSIWVLFCLIEWLAPRRKFGVYLTVNLILTSVFFAVIMYYKYFGVIVTYHALQQVGQVTEVKGSVFSLLHPYFLFIYTDVVAFLLLLFSRRFRTWGKSLAVRESNVLISALFVVSAAVSVMNVWIHRDSINELKQAENMGILNYEVYAIIASATEKVEDPSNVTAEAIADLKGYQEPNNPLYWAKAKGRNVIVIQVEAEQNFLLNRTIDGKEITPVMNRLTKEHFYFPHFYQQVGQGNTSDAEFVVNTSFYIPQHGAAAQDYGKKALPSMPKLLEENGYQTATFHTNDVQFWNRKELYSALGFQKYYDAKFFGDDDVVFFGSSDEVLYNKTADEMLKMSQSGQPFYSQVISMSSHHPFDIPERKIRFELPERYQNTLVGDYIQAQNYADYSLGLFIDKLKQNGLWDKSVIVIYGDHMGLPIYSLTDHEKSLMEELYDRPYQFPEMMNIPLMIIAPGIDEPKVFTQTGGQVDLFPTIANLLGVSMQNHIHFGQDILNVTHNLLPQRYYLPSGSFINDNGIFVPGLDFKDGTNYPFDGNKPAETDSTIDEYNRALALLKLSDSYVSGLPKY